ncbi:MAG: hypothetical protein CVT48_05395 [Thermoplasmata archaeon HGW-Thermoplasmata-1]|nr:MAG: hypothetical protein CVT48_05395 [Thermoplasmata archaeon HGW-Thermoplasmata-1]
MAEEKSDCILFDLQELELNREFVQYELVFTENCNVNFYCDVSGFKYIPEGSWYYMCLTDGKGLVEAYDERGKRGEVFASGMRGLDFLVSIRMSGKECQYKPELPSSSSPIDFLPGNCTTNVSGGTHWYFTMICYERGEGNFLLEVKTDKPAFVIANVTRSTSMNYIPDASCFHSGEHVMVTDVATLIQNLTYGKEFREGGYVNVVAAISVGAAKHGAAFQLQCTDKVMSSKEESIVPRWTELSYEGTIPRGGNVYFRFNGYSLGPSTWAIFFGCADVDLHADFEFLDMKGWD